MAGLPAVVAAVLPCGPRHAGLKLSDVLHRLSLPYTALQRSWMLAALALRAIGEHVQRLRQLGVAVLFHEPCAAVAAGAAARFALDREVGTRKSESVCAWSRTSRCAGGLLELGCDFCDRDTLDPGTLDCPEQEPLGGVPNGLRELLPVVLHRLVSRFVAILELDLGHQVHHEAPHCFLLQVSLVPTCALLRFALSSSSGWGRGPEIGG